MVIGTVGGASAGSVSGRTRSHAAGEPSAFIMSKSGIGSAYCPVYVNPIVALASFFNAVASVIFNVSPACWLFTATPSTVSIEIFNPAPEHQQQLPSSPPRG